MTDFQKGFLYGLVALAWILIVVSFNLPLFLDVAVSAVPVAAGGIFLERNFTNAE